MISIPYWLIFVGLWAAAGLGYGFAALLFIGRKADDDAEMVGIRARRGRPTNVLGREVVAPAPAEAVVVGAILEAKKTRVSRATKNGEVK
jgi:hypothetical protein